MKLSDFILLSIDEKQEVALHKGILIGKRKTNKHFLFLFQLNAYYVELVLDLEDRNIREVRAFDKIKLLNPYLEAIPIDHLLT